MYFVGRWVMHRTFTSFCCAILQLQKTAECERKRDDSSTTLSNPLTHSLSLSLSLSLYLDDATWVLMIMPLGCSRSESANLPTYFTREEKKGEIAKLRHLQNFFDAKTNTKFCSRSAFFLSIL